MLLPAPRDVTASTNAGTSERLHETDNASAHQNSAEHTCIWLAMVRPVSPGTEHAPAKAMTVSPKSTTAPVGGGRAWPDNEPTRLTRHQRPGTTGVVGTGGTGGHGRASRRVPARTAPQAPPACRTPGVWGPGCGARGRWQGLAGLRTPSLHQVPPVWRAPEGPEGQAAVPVGGGRAWPGFEHHQYTRCRRRVGRRGYGGQAAVPVGGGGAWPGFEATRRAKLAARTARGRAAAHGHTEQPGPAGRRPRAH